MSCGCYSQRKLIVPAQEPEGLHFRNRGCHTHGQLLPQSTSPEVVILLDKLNDKSSNRSTTPGAPTAYATSGRHDTRLLKCSPTGNFIKHIY